MCLHVVVRRVYRLVGDERTLGAEELPRDVESLATDDNNLLAAQQLLGNDAGKAAQKVALAVNDDLADTQIVSILSSLFMPYSCAVITKFHRRPMPCDVVDDCCSRGCSSRRKCLPSVDFLSNMFAFVIAFSSSRFGFRLPSKQTICLISPSFWSTMHWCDERSLLGSA